MAYSSASEKNKKNPASEAEILLGLITELSRQLHPQRLPVAVDLGTHLDEELGLDSLGRVELWQRIEGEFGFLPPSEILAEARTPGDLLSGLRARTAQMKPSEQGKLGRQSGETRAFLEVGSSKSPHRAGTLVEVLRWRVEHSGEHLHVRFFDGAGEDLSYRGLWDGAVELAWGLRMEGLRDAEPVAIMLPTGREYLCCFFGVLLAGGVPVPLYPPFRANQAAEYIKRHGQILHQAKIGMLITPAENLDLGNVMKDLSPFLRRLTTPQRLMTQANRGGKSRGGKSWGGKSRGGKSRGGSQRGEWQLGDWKQPSANSLAHLQYTSGSTGDPKGVMLTHAQLLANIRAMGKALQVSPSDRFVSWLPLYHDMGLIGAWLGSLYHGIPLGLMSPFSFLTRPMRWLEVLSSFGGTISGGPNFAYELCLRQTVGKHRMVSGLNLKSWRYAFNGAEPVLADTLRRFWHRFADSGLSVRALMPVYGLAECSVGLAFSGAERGVRVEQIDKEVFEARGLACLRAAGGLEVPLERGAMEVVSCGMPLSGHEVRVVNYRGAELAERREGLLQFRGPSATEGYYLNPKQTAGLYGKDGWLQSGDRGYLSGGEVYVTGRDKDVIVRAGRNLHPHLLEVTLGRLKGVRRGCVVVFGVLDTAIGSERVIAALETRVSDEIELDKLRLQVSALALSVWDSGVDEVLFLKPKSVLKTSSGKIRRQSMRELYLQGRLRGSLGGSSRGTFLGTRRRYVHRVFSGLLRWSYGSYVWLWGCLFLPMACFGILGRVSWRYACLSWLSRILLKLGGVFPRVQGKENVPKTGAFVLVSNHTSYLDSLVLVAVLSRSVRFVAKADLTKSAFLGWFLGRLQTVFVAQLDSEKGTQAVLLDSVLQEGGGLMVFPEGAITRQPGLKQFRLGAFSAAARLGVPVIPVVLKGVRDMLRLGRWQPQFSKLQVKLLTGIQPSGKDWQATVKLSAQVREAMLAELDEPDLDSL